MNVTLPVHFARKRRQPAFAVSAFFGGLMVLLLIPTAIQPAQAATASEGKLVSLTNSARRANGVQSLRLAGDLESAAHRHSADMAASGHAFHSSLAGNSGENVAKVHSVDEAHRLFMKSPTHRSNILYPGFTVIGTGVVAKGGWLYVTELFSRRAVPRVRAKTTRAMAAPRPKPTASGRARVVSAPVPPRTVSVLLELLALDPR